VTSQCPIKQHCPRPRGQSVGGVSERVGAKAGGSNLSARKFLRVSWRSKASWLSGRRLSSRGAVGMKASIGPFRVRRFLRCTERADDSGCPEVAEEGNAVGMRHKAHAPIAGTRDRRKRTGDASFARSFDPCTSILTMLRRGNSRRWGVRRGITVGQTHASERNHHWGHYERTGRGSPRTTALAREKAWFVRKGRRSRPPSLRGSKESPGLVARTSKCSCRSQ
jgi:hypothetical protein